MVHRLLAWTIFFAVAAPAASADLVQSTSATAERTETGVRISVTVVGAQRDAHDVDLLIRLASAPSEAGNALEDLFDGLEPFVRVPWGTVQLSGGALGERLALRATQLSPIPPGTAALVTQRQRRAWVRYRVPGYVAAGAKMPLTIELPFAIPDIGAVDAMAIGYRFDTLQIDDFNELPSLGVVGLTVLLRSAGLEGTVAARQAQLDRLRRQTGLAATIHDMLLNELLDVGPVHTFGVAAAGWLIPALDSPRWIDLSVTAVTTSGGRTWSERFSQAMGDQNQDDPLTWALALDHLVPRAGKGAQMVRILALGTSTVTPPANADLVPRLATVPQKAATKAAISAFIEEAGASLLAGAPKWPKAKLVATLKQLGAWRVGAVAAELLESERGRTRAERLIPLVGREVVIAAMAEMIADRLPARALEALATGSPKTRSFVRDVMAVGGAPVLAEVQRVSKETGYPVKPPIGPEMLKVKPKLLAKLVDRLQGVLMTPQAAQLEAEAERLFMREGDCLTPLDRAKSEIHRLVVVPQPLYANCQALRAVELMNQGKFEESEALIVEAVKSQPWERPVRRHYRMIMTARARRLLDQGKIDEAEALCEALDPQRADAQVRGIRADLFVVRGQQALAAGDRPGAYARFVEAREYDPGLPSIERLMGNHAAGRFRPVQLLVILMALLGFFAAAWRYRNVQQAIEAIRLGSRVAEFHGDGQRRLLVASGGVVATAGWSAKLIPWGQVRLAATTGHSGGPPGVIFWQEDGTSFFLSARSFDRFGTAAEVLSKSANASQVLFEHGPGNDDFVTAENSDMALQLIEAEKRRSTLRLFGVLLGLLIWACLTILDIGVGQGTLARMLSGLAIGGGFAMLVLALTDKMLPPASM